MSFIDTILKTRNLLLRELKLKGYFLKQIKKSSCDNSDRNINIFCLIAVPYEIGLSMFPCSNQNNTTNTNIIK